MGPATLHFPLAVPHTNYTARHENVCTVNAYAEQDVWPAELIARAAAESHEVFPKPPAGDAAAASEIRKQVDWP